MLRTFLTSETDGLLKRFNASNGVKSMWSFLLLGYLGKITAWMSFSSMFNVRYTFDFVYFVSVNPSRITTSPVYE